MIRNTFGCLCSALLVCATASVGAQAANYVELSGKNVDFFYDADVFGSATVTDDVISFALTSDYSATGKVRSLHGEASGSFFGGGKGALVAVGHQGVTLKGEVLSAMEGSFTTSGAGGSMKVTTYGRAYAGTFTGGQFTSAYEIGSFAADARASGQSGSFRAKELGTWWHKPYIPVSVLGFDVFGYGDLTQNGRGQSSVQLNSLSVGVRVVGAPTPLPPDPISVVPEPETYAMMLFGLGALGLMARRRNSAV